MMYRFRTLDQLDSKGKTVLVRADLNVPLSEGRVADDYRIRQSLPAIQSVRAEGAVTVVCSHLGRPTGPDPALRMDPVAQALGALGGFEVHKLDQVVGPDVEAAVAAASPGDVVLLENTRFEPGETSNDPDLSAALSRLADVFVLDAFGSAHRAHASTVGVAEYLPSVAGPLLASEVTAFERLLENPARPFVVVVGGAKVSDKIGVVRNLLPKVDALLVGGGMCFTMLAAEGYEVGASLLEKDMIGPVDELLRGPLGTRVSLPSDVVVGDRFDEAATWEVVAADRIPHESVGLDIGAQTAYRFGSAITGSRSVYWNGPMGVFEWEPFRAGTAAVARAVADFEGFSVVGGGDTVAALRMFGLDGQVSHVSTGGGAGLELLEGRTLPGLAALERWADGP